MLNNFDGLKNILNNNKTWPLSYMFKFIVPNKDDKIDDIKKLLPSNGQLSYRNTKNLKHISVTCVSKMESADDIIYIMQQAEQIKGVMSL